MKFVEKKESWLGWYISIVCAFSAAVVAGCTAQFSLTLAPLAQKLGVTEAAVALSDPPSAAMVILAELIAPLVMKKFGVRATFILSALLFVIPQTLIPYAPNYFCLVALKLAQGFCAMLFPLALSLIVAWGDARNVGLATSIFTGVFYAGGTMGGAVAGGVVSLVGWEASYHVLSAAMIAMSVLFLSTVRGWPAAGEMEEETAEERGSYRSVVFDRRTWFLILAFLPTIWAIQTIWADMAPFGEYLGYSEAEAGGVMGIAAVAILVAALASGKASDWLASRSARPLAARVCVLSAGTVLIAIGVLVIILSDLAAPNIASFHAAAFFLSLGAAWGLGSFYCIIPEIYEGERVNVANGFAGGVADMAMPLSPTFMAIVGLGMGMWSKAWLFCIPICAAGLVFSLLVARAKPAMAANRVK